MKKLTILAVAAALTFPTTAVAQSAQEQLDDRYNRALAAGYKALMLCSAIANAEANGATRTPESVHEWELTGIQSPLDDMVREMPFEIVRRPTGQIAHVQVDWADDMPDRVALYFGYRNGCAVMPIGTSETHSAPEDPFPFEEREAQESGTSVEVVIEVEKSGADGPIDTSRGALSRVINSAFDESYGEGRTTAALVRTIGDGGNSIDETARYAPGYDENTPQRTWSVAKSIASTIVGMATTNFGYSVNDPINLNYWRAGGRADLRSAITIDHALRMASGRYSDTPGNRTDPIYWGGTTSDERATHWPIIYQPGTVYRYSNNDTLMAVKAIEEYINYYERSDLMAQIGMHNTVIETDSRGSAILSSQVWSTAPDLANLGQLNLQNGMWNGERILPENWREYVSSPSGPQPERDWGYGAGWWLFNDHDGIPADTFLAAGNRGQYVVVVPSRNVVIVRRGEDMVGTRFDIESFTRDVLAALEE